MMEYSRYRNLPSGGLYLLKLHFYGKAYQEVRQGGLLYLPTFGSCRKGDGHPHFVWGASFFSGRMSRCGPFRTLD